MGVYAIFEDGRSQEDIDEITRREHQKFDTALQSRKTYTLEVEDADRCLTWSVLAQPGVSKSDPALEGWYILAEEASGELDMSGEFEGAIFEDDARVSNVVHTAIESALGEMQDAFSENEMLKSEFADH